MRGKLAKWGKSTALRLPASALNAAGLSCGDEVEIVARDGVVELRAKWRVPTIAELFGEAEKDGPLEPPEPIDWGLPVGAEIIDDDWSDIAPTDEEMGISDAKGRRT
jgi:antitoxin component of MazEF toxin-antitoxin module